MIKRPRFRGSTIKRLALCTTALSFFLLGTEPAAAGPAVALIGSIIGAVASGSGIAQIVLGLAVKIGLTLLSQALTPDGVKAPAVGVKLQMELGDDKPVSTSLGTWAVRGKRKYFGTYGDEGGTPNSHYSEVVELGSLPVAGLDAIYMDGAKCTIYWDQEGARGFPIKEYRDDGKDHAWIRFHDGFQTVADTYLRAKFGNHDKRPWKATMVGRGIPYAVMTYRYNREVVRGIPACVFVLTGIPLYDIRKDSSVGGNGSHRWADQSTWEPSQNLVVQAYNVIRGLRYQGEWFYGGQSVAAGRLPASNWIAAANESSRLIDNADGSKEPQFRGGIEIDGDVEPIEAARELLKGCGGRISLTAGTIKVQVGVYGAGVFAFNDADIVVTEGASLDPFPTIDQTVNGLTGIYVEPDEAWTAKDAPALYDTSLESLDASKRLTKEIKFGAVKDKRQTQRLMRLILKEERRFAKHQIVLPPAAWVVEGNDVVTWSSQHNGYINKRFRVISRRGRPAQNQVLLLQEIDPSDRDWSPSFELPTSTGWLGKIETPAQAMQGWTVEASDVKDAASLARRPAIKIGCGAGLDDVKGVWARVRVKATGAVVFDSDQQPYDKGDPAPRWLMSGNWCLPATQYEVAGKLVPFSGRKTDWSAWFTVTTSNLLIATADIFDSAVIQAKIADAAINASKIQDEGVTNQKLAAQAVTTSKLAVAAVTADVLANGSVVNTKLADAVVTAAKLAAEAVDATKFASSIEPVTVVAGLPAGRVTASVSYLGRLYRWNGSQYVVGVATGEITGQITVTQIADGSISTPKLMANAVTVNEIAANAVTTAKIASGAVSTDQLAAFGVVAAKIAGGAITADKLAVGSAVNQIPNADFSAGMTGWGKYISGGTWYGPSLRTDNFGIPTGSMEVVQGGTAVNDQFIDIFPLNVSEVRRFVVQPSKKYELSVYVYGHRSNYCRIHIQWLNAANVTVGYSYTDAPTHQNGDPGKNLANYARPVLINTAPVDAVGCYIFFRCWGNTAAYGTDSYTWLAHPYFGEAQPNQSEPSSWSSGAVTLIEGGHIVTGAVTVDKVGALAITTEKLAVGAVTAVNLQAGSVITDKLYADAVTGDKLAANSVYSKHVVADSITAKQLVLTDFNNLVPDNQMKDASCWNGGFSLHGDHMLFASYNGVVFNGGPWGSGGYAGPGYSKNFPVKPNAQYLCVGQAYSNNYWSAIVRVTFYDGNGTVAAYYDFIGEGSRAPGGATGRQVYTSPSNARQARIELYVQRNETGGPVYFGSMGVYERNAADLIVDGGITANHIASNSISTIMMQAGSVTTDKLVVGGVTFDKLAQNASTRVRNIVLAGGGSFSSGVYEVGQTRQSIDNSRDAVLLTASARLRQTSGSAFPQTVTVYIQGDSGAVVAETDVTFVANNVSTTASLATITLDGSGDNYSFYLRISKSQIGTILVGRTEISSALLRGGR